MSECEREGERGRERDGRERLGNCLSHSVAHGIFALSRFIVTESERELDREKEERERERKKETDRDRERQGEGQGRETDRDRGRDRH